MAGPRIVQVNIVGDSSKLSSAMKKAGDDTQTATGRISAAWRGVGSSLSGAFGSALEPIMGTLSGLSGAVEGLHKSVGTAMVGIGGASLAAGTGLQVLASKDKAAQQQLGQAFDNIGQNIDEYQGRIDKSVKSMTKFGDTGDQVKNSLTTLVTATKDPAKAFDLLQTAANLAALKHESLSAATDQLVKVISGKGTRTLTELGISMQKTGKHGYDVTAALDEITKRTHGQAAAASDTYKGHLEALRAELENHVAEFGQKYGPALQGVGAIVGTTGAAIETYRAITSGATVANEAMAASEVEVAAGEGAVLGPVLLIIAALAALGVGIYELVTHWSTVWGAIKDVVLDAWHVIDGDFIQPIEGFFTRIGGFIKAHWDLILGILLGPIGLAADMIGRHFDSIVGFFEKVPGVLMSAMKDVGKVLADPFIFGINMIIDAWNFLMDHFKIPGFHIGPIGWSGVDLGAGLKIGHVPYLAEGGIVTGPTLAMLGEAGSEAVVPLDRAGFGGGNQPQGDIVLELDGQTLARVAWPYIRTHALQTTGRNARRVGLA